MSNVQGSALILRAAKRSPRRYTRAGIWIICLFMVFSSSLAFAAGRKNRRDKPGKKIPADQVLILYDADDSISWAWIGEIHARMLANLLGHFPLPFLIKPVNEYAEGDVFAHETTFYLGSLYGRDLPAAFLTDVETTENTVCWFKYNMEQIDSSFVLLQGTGSVYYRGKTFTKHPADLELGSVSCQPGECIPVSTASVSGGWDIPYILQKGSRWYIADLPFSFISEEDRYLVFADVLHDILGVTHSHLPRALIRIEDVDPSCPPDVLMNIADYLYAQGAPYAVSVVPVYNDPTGRYNGGIPKWIAISDPDSQEFVEALRYMENRGGKIFLHGYTHQYTGRLNPWTGVTGDDFEFYLVEETADGNLAFKGPVPEDSSRWVRKRIRLAKQELREVGFSPVGWVTPHYAASPMDYRYFASSFPVTIQRVLYSNEEFEVKGHEGWNWEVSQFAGQFFPYVIQRDVYAQKVLPENAGYVDPENWQVEKILGITEKNLAMREPWASVFYHPFLDLLYPGNTFLADLVEGIQAQGYTFVDPSSDLN